MCLSFAYDYLFWVSGRQIFFASAFLHCWEDYCKKCRWPRFTHRRPLWLLITFVTLLRKALQQASPHAWADVLQAPMVCCCLHKHVCKMASWPLDFAIGVPITNRTNLDLVRPSVHYPLLPAPCPLWIPYGQPHSGFLAGKHFLQVLLGLLVFAYHVLTNSLQCVTLCYMCRIDNKMWG